VPNFSEIALPLTALLKKDLPEKVHWNNACEEALAKLKKALVTKPCLHPHDNSKDYHLFYDSSYAATGALLGQSSEDSQQGTVIHAVAYYSKKLTGNQLNWSTIEKELFSFVSSVQFFHDFVYDHKIHCYSDQRPLLWLNALTSVNARLTRWSLFLAGFDITSHFISGVNNVVADILSRL
jgi:hypothetical protein